MVVKELQALQQGSSLSVQPRRHVGDREIRWSRSRKAKLDLYPDVRLNYEERETSEAELTYDVRSLSQTDRTDTLAASLIRNHGWR